MKKLFAGLVLILVATALVACVRPEEQIGPDRLIDWVEIDQNVVFDRQTPVTINYWHRMGALNETQFNRWVEQFEDLFPNITVNMHHTGGGYDDLQAAVLLELVIDDESTKPDVMESYPDHVLTYMGSGRPVAINNLLTARNISGLFHEGGSAQQSWLDILPAFRAESQYDNSAQEGMDGHNADFEITGSIMSLPLLKSTEFLIFNRMLAESEGWIEVGGDNATGIVEWGLPTTWEGWREFGPTIREVITPAGAGLFPIGYDSPGNWFITGMLQANADYITGRWELDADGNIVVDEDGEPVAVVPSSRVAFNNEGGWNMTNFFRGMVRDQFMTTRELSQVPFLSAVFVNGELFSSIGSSAGLRNSVTNAAIGNNVVAGVTTLPTFEGGRRTQIQQGPNVSMFANRLPNGEIDEHRLIASWLFMQFITSTERNAEFVTAYAHPQAGTGAPGNIPHRASVLNSFAFSEWARLSVPLSNYSQFQITAEQIRNMTLQQRENRIAFDAIALSAARFDENGMLTDGTTGEYIDFFVTPAFEFSSAMRTQATPLINAIVVMPDGDDIMARIQARFLQAYRNVLNI